MSLKRSALFLHLLLSTIVSFSQTQASAIPSDTTIVKGELKNGTTYYIKQDKQASGRASFYLIQKTGALQEDDSQKGLAHFLEHMCFRGTTHFPEKDIINYCESLGLQFGGDLNAVTSMDETTFRICNIPTRRTSTVDSCLLILHDWAGLLTLSQKAIDEERKVIKEEWRLRNNATQRLIEKNLPLLCPCSRYGIRTPLGCMDVVDAVNAGELRTFYKKWYRPENQAVVIIGDINAAQAVRTMERIFATSGKASRSMVVTPYGVPDNDTPIVIVDKDAELKTSHVKLFIKHEPLTEKTGLTTSDIQNGIALDAAADMVNRRLAERAGRSDCPFLKAVIKNGTYVYARTQKAIELSVVPTDISNTSNALREAVAEVYRAIKSGFGSDEYNDYRRASLSDLMTRHSKSDGAQVLEACKNNFIYGQDILSPAAVRQAATHAAQSLKADMPRHILGKLFVTGRRNMVIVSFNKEQTGTTYPTADDLLDAVEKGAQQTMAPYQYRRNAKQLSIREAEPGTITEEKVNDDYGYTSLRLSNGATVILKRTDVANQPIRLRAEGCGGTTEYGKDDLPQVKMVNYAIQASALADMSAPELMKWLGQRNVRTGMSIGSLYTNINGQAGLEETETLLQLTNLYLTDIRSDRPTYDMMARQLREMIAAGTDNQDNVMTDSINATLYAHNPWLSSLTANDIENASYDRMLSMIRERTCDMSQWTFYITGCFDDTAIRQLICRYIASIKSKHSVNARVKTTALQKGTAENIFTHEMKVPRTNAYIVWHNDRMEYSAENTIRMSMIGQMLSSILLERIRQESQAAYTCEVKGEVTLDMGYPLHILTVMCPVTPGKEDMVMRVINEEVKKMGRSVDDKLLDKVRTYEKRRYASGFHGNAYWEDVIHKHCRYGIDGRADYENIAESQNADDIRRMMRTFLKRADKASIIMMPQKK